MDFSCQCSDRHLTAHLEPTLGHEEVVFNTFFPKLVRNIKAHGTIFIVDLTFGLIIKNGVGIVDLFKLFSCFWVVWVFVWVVPECKFPESTIIIVYYISFKGLPT